MGIERAFRRFQGWLEGWPSAGLSALLVAAALVLLLVAWRGKPWEKIVVASWVLFP
ncbi:MAG TPA: hypothetical protein VKQ30_25450 [Ktedonobacterales bacterium]|nr:hypothetical protein [Ktedonobacterales bacterium]